MKRILIAATITVFAAPGAFAATDTWTGKIGDSACGLSHAGMIAKSGGKMTETECTEACIKAGAKYVFISGGKVYTLANQDFKDLAANAGKTVRLAGDMHDSTITVSKVSAPPTTTPKKN